MLNKLWNHGVADQSAGGYDDNNIAKELTKAVRYSEKNQS
jgi:hypothetical protein